MADYVMRVGKTSVQGARSNNEDALFADPDTGLFMVADGMGGQDRGEQASGMAVDIIPRVVVSRLAAHDAPPVAVQRAFSEANNAIVEAGKAQPAGRRMGTTAVLALKDEDRVYVAGCGDSRAYLIRGDRVEQLTVDHSVAQALVNNGVLSAEEAKHSPWQHVLHKFLGCAEMTDGAEVQPFTPQAGDKLVLASDGLTNHVDASDLTKGAKENLDPQKWAEQLVDLALSRNSRDNVTCVVLAFDRE